MKKGQNMNFVDEGDEERSHILSFDLVVYRQ